MKKPTEFHRRFRPSNLDEVYGHEKTVKILRKYIREEKLPHVLLFEGDSGVGKTTLARIVVNELGIGYHDLTELNVADTRGIEDIRRINRQLDAVAMKGDYRAWIFDEVHRATGDFQSIMLKMCEDTPDHVFLILCTTDPDKLLKALRSRCTTFHLDKISEANLKALAKDISERAKIKPRPKDKTLDKLSEVADGSARQCLVLLEKMSKLKNEEDRLELLERADTVRNTKSLAQTLMGFKCKPGQRPDWNEVKDILKDLQDDTEKIRQGLMGYCRSVCLGGGRFASQAMYIINIFRDWSIGDSDNAKSAILMANCFEICSKKR